jgi:hypothetical protein
MTHNYNDIFTITNEKGRSVLCTGDYLRYYGIDTDEILNRKFSPRRENKINSVRGSYEHKKITFELLTLEGTKIMYAYGKYSFFDTLEERNAYKQKELSYYAEKRERKKLYEKITAQYDNLSIEELRKIVENIK